MFVAWVAATEVSMQWCCGGTKVGCLPPGMVLVPGATDVVVEAGPANWPEGNLLCKRI